MKTLLEKWDFYNSEIKRLEKNFINANIINPPKALYEVFHNGKIRVLIIDEVLYYNGQRFTLGPNRKRPTKIEVERVKSYYENIDSLSLENIMFAYHYNFESGGTGSGWIKYKDLNKYLTESEAKVKSEEFTNKHQMEQSLIDSGTHIRCERCRNLVESDKIVHYHLVSYYTYGPSGRNGKFCSSKCAGDEQMALEG